MKKILMFISVFIIAISIVGCSQESNEEKEENVNLSIGTTNTSSSLYAYYGGLSKSVQEQAPEISMTIVETGATIDNVKRLEKGQIDIGLAVMDGAYEAYDGIGEWEGNSQEDLRHLFTYTENALYYVVTEDSEINSIKELDGKKFNPGIRGSTTEGQTESIFKLLGVDYKSHQGDISDAVNAIKDGDIIGLTKTGLGTSPDATVMDLETSKSIRLLGYTDDEMEEIQKEFPWIRSTEIPAGVYEWQTEPINTIAQQVGNITTTELSDDVAYKITKAAFEEKEFQEEAYNSIKDLDFADMTLESPIPLHAGAVKYLKEQDVDIPDELIPSEYED